MKRNVQAVLSLVLIITAMSLQTARAQAATSSDSIEFMCKAKAKEIAAQTYSGCINDNKQAELDRIRKEYQAELAKIKSKYNSELKGLSGKKGKTASKGTQKSLENQDVSTGNSNDMPAKKMTTSRVKTEKIDFTTDHAERNDSQQETRDSGQNEVDQNDLGARSGSDSNLTSTEIVEIPIQPE